MNKKITKIESIIIEFLQKNIVYLFLGVAFIASIVVRKVLFPYLSDDMTGYLVPWYMQIEQLGKVHALNVQVGNYNVAYQTIIAFLTYLPGDTVTKYKIVSCIFDYVLAAGVFMLLFEKENKETLKPAIIGTLIALFSPIVFLNSGAWGQCDAIYVSFILLSFAFYKKNKLVPAFLFFGLAFAFKLQAVFFLPFYLYEWFRRKNFSCLNFLFIPLSMIVVCIPAYINGRGFWGFISPYYYQTGSCDQMFFSYPSFWAVLSGSEIDKAKYVGAMKYPAIIITVLILAGIMVASFKRKQELTEAETLNAFLLMAFTCVEFLPGMHERYGFGVEILAIILALKDKKTIPYAIALNVLTLITYGAELFNGNKNMVILGIVNIVVYVLYTKRLFENKQ